MAIVIWIIEAFPLNYFVVVHPPHHHILCFKRWEVGVEFPLARVQMDRAQTETTPGCRMVTGWLSSLTSFIVKPLLLCIFKSPSGFIKEHRRWPTSLFHYWVKLIPRSQIRPLLFVFWHNDYDAPFLGCFPEANAETSLNIYFLCKTCS